MIPVSSSTKRIFWRTISPNIAGASLDSLNLGNVAETMDDMKTAPLHWAERPQDDMTRRPRASPKLHRDLLEGNIQTPQML